MLDCMGFDFETHLMGPQRVAPPPVCISAHFDGDSVLYGQKERGEFDSLLEALFDAGNLDFCRAAHNLSFDLAVACSDRPDLFPSVFSLLEADRLHCTIIREKLLNLVITGQIDFIELPDGSNWKVDYSLGGLMKYHFGIDISDTKNNEDAWRLNYAELEDTPVDEWPEDAQDYAINDSVHCVMLHRNQEERRQLFIEQFGIDPFETLNFRCMADFCLQLMTCWGLRVDADQKAKIEAMLAEELSPKNLRHLLSSGILRPGEPPRPYANGAKNEDGTPKMTRGAKESIDKSRLSDLVESVCVRIGRPVPRTEPTDRFPDGQVSTKAEIIEELAHHDDVLLEYQNRQKLQKLVTTELPRMEWEGRTAAVVHPGYDVLKRTGRTSSYASKNYPSFNCQNVDPRVRNCFVPRQGFVLFSIDYSQMELGTLAQKCIDLFGESVMAELINAGHDLHSYLGAKIAASTNEGFAETVRGLSDFEIYQRFFSLKTSESDEQRKFWKHYRTLAKPTGLGYPGGLGPETFMAYAKATYGIKIDLDTAHMLREVWKETFPEMPEYFKFINEQCIDERFSSPVDGHKYAYTTPFGLYRPNADYCAAANGIGLQSPSAEGAILGLINTVRGCFDWSLGSILADDDKGPTTRPICFVHDEQVGEVRDDEFRQQRVEEISRIMVESMRAVTPDVEPRTEIALMTRWDKRAEAVYDSSGNLVPWEAPEKE